MTKSRIVVASALAASAALAACGGSDDAAPVTAPSAAVEETATAGIRVVSATEAAATIDAAPDGLVILDVRTPEEYAEGHVADAVLLDFYRDDFTEQLATFDPDVPYVLYCRSGNRSSQARAIMSELGFASVEDVDGGIVGWLEAGLPVVTD